MEQMAFTETMAGDRRNSLYKSPAMVGHRPPYT